MLKNALRIHVFFNFNNMKRMKFVSSEILIRFTDSKQLSFSLQKQITSSSWEAGNCNDFDPHCVPCTLGFYHNNLGSIDTHKSIRKFATWHNYLLNNVLKISLYNVWLMWLIFTNEWINWLIGWVCDWLDLMKCQLLYGYFIPSV